MFRKRKSNAQRNNQSIRDEVNSLFSNGNSFRRFLYSSIEEINREKHALSDTNESLSRDLAKIDAEKCEHFFSHSFSILFSRTSIETDLRVEKDFRQRLQQALTTEKEKVSSLQFDMHELNLIKQVRVHRTKSNHRSFGFLFRRNMIRTKKK